ncbi:MAG: NAD(P)/FAD-dependent oxidoreductase [Elusimicrobia bacterium]|nr:NAD(P)/FAD-dependent oxidoreductase [Elusimicrobiota bacterium]
MGKTIIILGAGTGGIVCAHELRKHLNQEHKIIIIDKNEYHFFYPSLLWLICGWRTPEQIQTSLEPLNKKGIEFVQGEVVKIDRSNHLIEVNGKHLNYDYLVVSLGAELNKTSIPKTETIFNFYCLAGAKQARAAIANFKKGKIAVLISALPFRCPAAPYEAALLLDYFLAGKNTRKDIDLQIFTPENLPMPTAGPVLGRSLKQILEKRKIGFNPNLKMRSLDGSLREIRFEAERVESFDLLLVVPPHQPSPLVNQAGLAGETGWVPVDPKTLKTKYEKIYALGDITAIKLPNGKMLPKAGVFAHYQAEVIAYNIAHEINDSPMRKEFNGRGSCFLELGYGRAGFAKGNFYASPEPLVKLYQPGKIWHWGKLFFERWWFWKWF